MIEHVVPATGELPKNGFQELSWILSVCEKYLVNRSNLYLSRVLSRIIPIENPIETFDMLE